MSYLHVLQLAAPETIIVVTVLVVLAADLLTMREVTHHLRLVIGALICCVGCVAAIAWMFVLPEQANLGHGMLVADPLTQLVKAALLILAIFTALVSVETDFTDHVGEYFALILLAVVGMMFLVSSEDILMIFISLELTSLSLYILTAFNKRNIKSAEAALKYFLFGGMAAAFTLFGLSLLYGVSGSTNLGEIARGVADHAVHTVRAADGTARTILDPLLLIAIVTTVIGFGFKVAAVPFHLWAPDAYEGAPTPSAALIASGSKVASFFIFAKVMAIGFAGVEGSGAWRSYATGWVPVIAVVAAASMLLGNLVALVQNSVRRLLAYSAIAHAGYMLLAVLSHDKQSLASLVYYSVTYGLSTIGAFAVVSVVQQQTGGDAMNDFSGLSRRAPVPAFCMLIFMLSLAGIPPLAGFFGKFYIFASAVRTTPNDLGLLWLVIIAIAMSAVSLYYYLQVLKRVYVADALSSSPTSGTPVLTQVVLALIAALVLAMGCVPELFVGKILAAIQGSGVL